MENNMESIMMLSSGFSVILNALSYGLLILGIVKLSKPAQK